MLEDIQKYVRYVMISYKLNLCIEYCNIRDDWSFIKEWNSCITDIGKLLNERYIEHDELADDIQRICELIRANIDNSVLCANIIEEEMLPIIYTLIEKMKIDLPDCEHYELTYTKSGIFNLLNKRTKKLIHSMNNPMVEALRQSEYLYKSDAETILICGAGLGYLAYQLWIKSFKSAHIYIFERDSNILALARKYGVLGWIEEDSITTICESNEGSLFDELYALPIDFDRAICWVSEYFIENIHDESIYAGIKSFSDNIITRERFRRMEIVNVRYNKSDIIDDVTKLRERISSLAKEFIVVAAGPSLDYNIEYIKKNQGKKRIVVVESALRKLIVNEIKPDYVVVLDPTEQIMKYIDGIEDKTSELVLVAYEKANWKYVKSFQGAKYIINGRQAVNNEVDNKDIQSYISDCTTVSSLAIEVSLYLGAESVELVGLDLAFPNNKVYAAQVSDISKICTETMVRSVNGALVGTSYVFVQFKTEIEEIIKKSTAKFYNMSKEGALIQGTLMDKWWEIWPIDFENYLNQLKQETALEWNEKYYILWQAIHAYMSKECANNEKFWNGVADVFGSIEKQFVNQMDAPACKGTISDKYVVMLTSYYSDEPDEISEKIRNDAYKLKTIHGFEILVVNTREYMGGQKVALKECAEADISESINYSDAIFYMGEKIPFFSFENNMPDINQIRSFIEIISKRVPVSFLSYDPFSLVASACKLIGNVEYR